MILSVVSGPGTLSGSALTLTGAGTVVVAANQAGNSSFQAAPTVSVTIVVSQASQSIAFPAIATQTVGSSFLLSASASSGLPVSFATLSPTVCAVSGMTAKMLGAGTCILQATQPGSSNYGPAGAVTRSFTVGPAATTIAVTSSANPGRAMHPVTYTAAVTVTSGPPPSSGTVSFYQGKRLLATVPLNGSGQASFTTSYSSDDPVSITAIYSGSPNYLGSSSKIFVEGIKG